MRVYFQQNKERRGPGKGKCHAKTMMSTKCDPYLKKKSFYLFLPPSRPMIHRKEGWLLLMVWNSLPDSILHHASCSGLRISRDLPLRPFRTRLRLRGGSDQSLQEYGIERPKMQTYYDVDGTVFLFFLLSAAFWENLNFS